MLQVLMTIGALGAVIALLKVALAASTQNVAQSPDEIEAIWHRYETGDLTQWEFDRLRRGSGAAEHASSRKIAA